jgi:hypothetical protein
VHSTHAETARTGGSYNVYLWLKADILARVINVRFRGITLSGRAAADQRGAARFDQADEHR